MSRSWTEPTGAGRGRRGCRRRAGRRRIRGGAGRPPTRRRPRPDPWPTGRSGDAEPAGPSTPRPTRRRRELLARRRGRGPARRRDQAPRRAGLLDPVGVDGADAAGRRPDPRVSRLSAPGRRRPGRRDRVPGARRRDGEPRRPRSARWHWLGETIGIASPPHDDFVKRVAGLPGDTVEIDRTGQLYVNGRAVDEPYLDPARASGGSPTDDGARWHAVRVGRQPRELRRFALRAAGMHGPGPGRRRDRRDLPADLAAVEDGSRAVNGSPRP